MARVICNLPHAAAEISGVKFTRDRGEMISEEVSDESAELFASIPGFRLAGEKPKEDAPKGGGDASKGDGGGSNVERHPVTDAGVTTRPDGSVDATAGVHPALPPALPALPVVPGDADGDGKLSAAEKRKAKAEKSDPAA